MAKVKKCAENATNTKIKSTKVIKMKAKGSKQRKQPKATKNVEKSMDSKVPPVQNDPIVPVGENQSKSRIENSGIPLKSKGIEVGTSRRCSVRLQKLKPSEIEAMTSTNKGSLPSSKKDIIQEKLEPVKKLFVSRNKSYKKAPDLPKKSEDVYNFSGLSIAEKSRSDPVIKEIIARKNVDVKVYKKGKIVSKRAPRKKKEKEVVEVKNDTIIEIEDTSFEDNSEINDISFKNAINSTQIAPKTFSPHFKVPSNSIPNFKSPVNVDLRRTAMMNLNRTAAEKKKLLEQARKLIPRMSSTPMIRKPSPSSTPKISPIAPLVNSSMRIEDEENYDLPHLHYFGRSSDLTPSFSSDIIPQTPQKKTKSFCVTNDSNEENIPPPDLLLQPNETDKNRRNGDGKGEKRAPFKEIVILKNTLLSPYELPTKKSTPKPSNAHDDDLVQIIRKRNSELYKPHKTYSKKNRDLSAEIENNFDFDELLSSQSPAKDPSNFNNSRRNNEMNVSKVSDIINALKEKRNERQFDERIVLATPKQKRPSVPSLFSPPRELPKRNIRDLLARKPGCSKEPTKEKLDCNANRGYIDEQLFKDPETSLDANKSYKTYLPPIRRSRKIVKLNDYVYDLESEDSEDEGIKVAQKPTRKRKKISHSNEVDSSDEDESGGRKQEKSRKKRSKEEEELENFCQQLNAEFEEVEKVVIPVEIE